ncbi:Histone-lysine N-methyltransferase SETMAR [Melipona quadrifasciata]|uniref:Histone-lysine N-methyltransferase SETMAR n=1 Tax=Melipona quadrifasciata TaxID=166423 RepID=A0A0M9ABH1_9HYME|nr:Histone-lysine N-methyltransferase SETMAR [Melipona quadrifasciata]
MESQKMHLRHVTLHCFRKGNSAKDTADEIFTVYGSGATTIRTVGNWFKKFRAGNFELKAEDRSGRPATTHTDIIKTVLTENPRYSVREIVDATNIPKTTVHKHLIKIGYRYEVWVPHLILPSINADKYCNQLDRLKAANKNMDGTDASMHMTRNCEWLNVKELPVQNIKLANSKALIVKSCGKVNITIKIHDETKQIRVRDIIYVPDLSSNLLSVSRILKSGCKVEFNDHGCTIINPMGQKVAEAYLGNDVYKLATQTKTVACLVTSNQRFIRVASKARTSQPPVNKEIEPNARLE